MEDAKRSLKHLPLHLIKHNVNALAEILCAKGHRILNVPKNLIHRRDNNYIKYVRIKDKLPILKCTLPMTNHSKYISIKHSQ